jgi:hypothetical protein
LRRRETLHRQGLFIWQDQLPIGLAVVHYLLMGGLGIILFLGACYTDRTVARSEPELAAIEPAIPKICFVAKSVGMMISVAAVGAAVFVAFS